MVAALAPGNTGVAYEALLRELPRTFALVRPEDHLVAFYRGTSSEWWKQLSLVERAQKLKALGAMIEPYREPLRKAFRLGVYYPSDLLQRVALRTWLTVVRSRATNHVVDTDAAAWDAIALAYAHPTLSFTEARDIYKDIIAKHAPKLAV